MATLQEIYAVSQPHGELAGRIEAAFIKTAWAILYEDGATENHVNRLNMAKGVLAGPRPYVERYYRAILSNAALQAGLGNTATISDEAVEAAVTGFWNIFANLEAA